MKRPLFLSIVWVGTAVVLCPLTSTAKHAKHRNGDTDGSDATLGKRHNHKRSRGDDGGSGSSNPLLVPQQLTAADVQAVIAQAVTRATQISSDSVMAVTDRKGDVLGVWTVRGGQPTGAEF